MNPVAAKGTKVTYVLYQVSPSGDLKLAYTAPTEVYEGPGNVNEILSEQTTTNVLVTKDIVKDGTKNGGKEWVLKVFELFYVFRG